MADFSLPDIFAEIDSQSTAAGVNPSTMKALLLSENTATGVPTDKTRFRGESVSPVGARGLFQVMPRTEAALKQQGFLPPEYAHNPHDLKSQVAVGVAAAREMQGRQTNKSDPYELSTMWNASTGSWRSYVAGKLSEIPAETAAYYTKMHAALTSLGGNAPTPPTILPPTGAGAGRGNQGKETPTMATTNADGSGSPAATALAAQASSDPTSFANMLMAGVTNGNSQQVISAAVGQINKSEAERQAAFAAEQAAILQHSIDIGKQVAARTAVDVSKVASRDKAVNAFNLQQNGVDDEMTKAFDAINRTNAAADPLIREIEQRKAVGIFDNPLQWLVNQTRLPGLIGEYNAIAGEQQRAVGALKQFQGLVQNQQSITQGADADAIATAGLADAAAAASEAQAKLAELQMRNATGNAQMARQDLNTAATMLNLDFGMVAKQEKLDAKAAVQKQADDVTTWYRSIGNNTVVTPEQLKLMGKKGAALIDRAGRADGAIGENLSDTITAMDEHGGSLTALAQGGSMAFATWVGAAKNKATAQATKLVAQDAARGAKAGEQVKSFDLHYKDALAKIQLEYQAETQNMDNSSELNPFKISYTRAAKLPELKDNLVAKYVNTFGPEGKTPLVADIKGDSILNGIASQVAQGTITDVQAIQQIKDFYAVANKTQQLATRPALAGLNPEVPGYQIRIAERSLWGGQNGSNVNLVTGAGLQAAIHQKVAYYQMLSRSAITDANQDSTYQRLDF